MSVSKLSKLVYEWESNLEDNFKDKFYDALETAEEDISDLEDKVDDLETEVSNLNREICRLESVIEDLKSDIEDDSECYCKSLEDELKEEWWKVVKEKYTLPQLESILGSRFNLKKN